MPAVYCIHGDSLCRYHGPPLKQLKQLSSQGTYKTKQAAVGGRQNGSINWPVEANIFLPTPHHITSHEAQATSALLPQQFGVPNGVEDCGLPAQQRKEGEEWGGEEEGGWGGEEEGGRREEGEYRMNREKRRVVYKCGKELAEEQGDGLVFESQFEGGNLQQAMQM